jgi:RNA polymerase sigma factor (sigma-70 family)
MDPHSPALLEGIPLARLYQEVAFKLLIYLRKQVSAPEDAEDILVDVFLAALVQEGFFSWSSPDQQAWLWRVAHNKTADFYRRYRRQRSVPLSLLAEAVFDQEAVNPEQVRLHQETEGQLHDFIRRLSPLQQEVLLLRFSGNLRCPQIASTLGKREGTIRSILSRTLHQLRRLYEHHPEGKDTA